MACPKTRKNVTSTYMDPKGSTILEGEASESDEEVTDYPSFIQNTMVAEFPSSSTSPSQNLGVERSSGVVVSGEASESDEEPFEYAKPAGGRDFPSLAASFPEPSNTSESTSPKQSPAQESTKFRDEYKRPKFNSPFHKRLRENNFYLRCGVVENCLDTYEGATSKLQDCTPVLNRTLNSVQSTLRDLRLTLEGLSVLQLTVDTVVESNSLPRFKKLEA